MSESMSEKGCGGLVALIIIAVGCSAIVGCPKPPEPQHSVGRPPGTRSAGSRIRDDDSEISLPDLSQPGGVPKAVSKPEADPNGNASVAKSIANAVTITNLHSVSWWCISGKVEVVWIDPNTKELLHVVKEPGKDDVHIFIDVPEGQPMWMRTTTETCRAGQLPEEWRGKARRLDGGYWAMDYFEVHVRKTKDVYGL